MALDRRSFIALACCGVLVGSRAEASPRMRVYKDPTCGCCGGWIEHVRGAGYDAEVIDTSTIDSVKKRFGVPDDLRSCHTAEIDGYVLEGHVPAAAIASLLSQRPKIVGLAAPGMPVGSPGMEVEGSDPETYAVIAFGAGRPSTFMRFKGNDPL